MEESGLSKALAASTTAVKNARSRSITSIGAQDSLLSTSLGKVPAEFAQVEPAKKQQGSGTGGDKKGKKQSNVGKSLGPASSALDSASKDSKASNLKKERISSDNSSLSIFGHLPEYERMTTAGLMRKMKDTDAIHPAIVSLGIEMAQGRTLGATERCLKMLECFKLFIQTSYTAIENQVISRHLDTVLKPQISYIVASRPLTAAMANAIRILKLQISHLPPECTEEEAKNSICQFIDLLVRNRIELAGKLIVEAALVKIRDGDVLLTFSRSLLVLKLFKEAKRVNKSFRVIVVLESGDAREGTDMVRELSQFGIQCTLISIGSIGFVMKEATKVFLGTHSVFSNGTLLGRVGTAVVGLMAFQSNVPVIVLSETLKFTEKVQLDAFVYNELGDPQGLIDSAASAYAQRHPNLPVPKVRACNLVYDVMPPEYITIIVSEVGMIPVTSVPVVLREQQNHHYY